MNAEYEFPIFDIIFSDLNNFILDLAQAYQTEKINSWSELEEKVKEFFTPEKMIQTETRVPGWIRMASYSEGITLTHVTCVFLGLFIQPEFQNLTYEQQQLAKWIVLFHDVEKEHIKGKRDFSHGFRGAAFAAKSLAGLEFPFTNNYANLIESWSVFTQRSTTHLENFQDPIQDNRKLPEIISGIEKLFGKNTPAALISKGVLLHMSINVVEDYPQAAPLTMDEINLYIDDQLRPLLKSVMLADNDGWVLFYPEVRINQRNETLSAFKEIEKTAHKNQNENRDKP